MWRDGRPRAHPALLHCFADDLVPDREGLHDSARVGRRIDEIVGHRPEQVGRTRLLQSFEDLQHREGISRWGAEDQRHVVALIDERLQSIADSCQKSPHGDRMRERWPQLILTSAPVISCIPIADALIAAPDTLTLLVSHVIC